MLLCVDMQCCCMLKICGCWLKVTLMQAKPFVWLGSPWLPVLLPLHLVSAAAVASMHMLPATFGGLAK